MVCHSRQRGRDRLGAKCPSRPLRRSALRSLALLEPALISERSRLSASSRPRVRAKERTPASKHKKKKKKDCRRALLLLARHSLKGLRVARRRSGKGKLLLRPGAASTDPACEDRLGPSSGPGDAELSEVLPAAPATSRSQGPLSKGIQGQEPRSQAGGRTESRGPRHGHHGETRTENKKQPRSKQKPITGASESGECRGS